MTSLKDLRIRLFADGGDLESLLALYHNPLIRGFTTNPTLMRKAGVTNYQAFAQELLAAVPDRPVSFEVLSDDFDGMAAEARAIGTWAENVYVKVPITNTWGQSSVEVLRDLTHDGIKLNVTAITTVEQVEEAAKELAGGAPAIISVFAGRIADTGRDPVPLMTEAAEVIRAISGVELLWASPRELLNIFHAEAAGCDIITVTTDILAKLPLVGKDLTEYSLETVKMFCSDSKGLGQVFPSG